jgi:hypothetical protein
MYNPSVSSVTHVPRAKSSPVSRAAAREVFRDGVELFASWTAGEPEPTVFYEDADTGLSGNITLTTVCKLVETCQSPLPKSSVETLRYCDVELPTRTYAAAAGALMKAIRKMRQAH